MQDLNGFSVPKGFRGGAVLGSYGGRFRPPLFALVTANTVPLASIFIASVWRKNRKRSHSSFGENYHPWKLTLGDYAG